VTPTPRPRLRLQTRIALHFVVFAAALASVLTLGSWWVITETEDAILDHYLMHALPTPQGDAGGMAWREEFSSAAALHTRLPLPLAAIPQASGWYTIFASYDGRQARLIRGWRDSIFVWTRGLEDEYRLQVRSAMEGGIAWTLIHVGPLEYTEPRIPALQAWLLGLAAATLVIAALLSARLAGSAMQPIVNLTQRLGYHDATEDTLAAHCAADEVGLLARALDEAWAREREALERERRFIADCSHELRTPLTVLRGALSLLEEERGTTVAGAELLARLQRTVGRIEGVAHTFLVMAREERRRTAHHPQPVAELLREAVAEQHLLFPHRRLDVTLAVPAEASVDGDRDVLLVLFRNLLNNAFQHSATETLHVDWDESPAPHLRFTEAAPPDAATLVASRTPGFGIGLPLVRRLIRQQGWRFEEARDPNAPRLQSIWFEKTESSVVARHTETSSGSG